MGVLRVAVGIMGNAASLSLFSSPILTFTRVIKKKSTEEFSCVPYIISFLNCLLFTWYGMPVVSCKWENFPVATINGLGILLEAAFIIIYFWFATKRAKVKVAVLVIPIILLFSMIAAVSTFAFHDRTHRKRFVGCFGVAAAAAMFGSPLVVMKKVIETKSVEFMPFYLSLFSFLTSSVWMIYGLLSHDLFIASPNFVGTPLAFLQLFLYFKYSKRGIMEEPKSWDLEKNEEKTKVEMEPVVDETVNAKS